MADFSKARFGIVGAGAIAQSYVQAFQECQSAKLVGIADVREKAAQSVAESVGCGWAHTAEDLIDTVPLDAVIEGL